MRCPTLVLAALQGLLGAVFVAPAHAASTAPSPGIGYRTATAAGVRMHIVQADIRRKDVHVSVATAAGGIGSRENWSAMIDRARPVAAITGTYFDTVSGTPVGAIGVAGNMIYEGHIGTAFLYSPDYGARIAAARPLSLFDFSGAETFLRAGPRLLTGGRTTLYPFDEGFRDPSIFQKKKRSALATTKQGKLLIVAVEKPVTLRELAAALKGLGAIDAMCLDGGQSTGLYYRGKSHMVPRRALTNLLVAYETNERYHASLPALNPKTTPMRVVHKKPAVSGA